MRLEAMNLSEETVNDQRDGRKHQTLNNSSKDPGVNTLGIVAKEDRTNNQRAEDGRCKDNDTATTV